MRTHTHTHTHPHTSSNTVLCLHLQSQVASLFHIFQLKLLYKYFFNACYMSFHQILLLHRNIRRAQIGVSINLSPSSYNPLHHFLLPVPEQFSHVVFKHPQFVILSRSERSRFTPTDTRQAMVHV